MRGRIPAFEASRQKTNLWVKDVAAELHCDDRRKAYVTLRSALHALRDCLPVEETAKFAAQMPLLLQGVLFEGWRPHRKPDRMTRERFFDRLRHDARGQEGLDPALMARATFVTLARHLSAGEIEAVRRVLPHEVRELWYELGHFAPSAGMERAVDAQAAQPPVPQPEGSRAYEPGAPGAPAWQWGTGQ